MSRAGRLRALVARLAGEEGARRSYWGSIATVMSGTVGAQAIGVVSMILLARIYSPAEFGLYAQFFALAGLLSLLSTGKYDQAVFVVKTAPEASQIVVLSLVLCSATALLVLALSPLAAVAPLDWGPHPIEFAILIALAIATGGASFALGALATQRKAFKAVANARLIQAVCAAGVSFGLGAYGRGATGLMWGFIVGQAALVLFLLRKASLGEAGRLDWRALTARAREHSRFPRFQLISDVINHIGANLIPLVTPTVFGPAPLGHYNMAQRVAGLPITIIGGALGEVFRSRISPQNLDQRDLAALFKRTAVRLSLIGAAFTLPLLALGPWVFATVFGPEWRHAGVYVQVLAPVIFGRFVVSPLSSVLMLGGQQKLDAILQSLFVVAAAAAFAVGFVYHNFFAMVVVIAVLHSGLYALYFACCYKTSMVISRA